MVLFIILYKAVLTFESVDEILKTVPMKPLGRTFKKFHCFGNLTNEVWCNFLICKTHKNYEMFEMNIRVYSQNIRGLDSNSPLSR